FPTARLSTLMPVKRRRRAAVVIPVDLRPSLRDWWRVFRTLVLAAAVGVALWNPLRPTPMSLYQQASSYLPSEPMRASWMLRTAVAEAGGDFPDAQIQLCLIAIQLRDWDELERVCATLRWENAHSDSLLSLGYMASGARQIGPARQAYLELARRGSSCEVSA